MKQRRKIKIVLAICLTLFIGCVLMKRLFLNPKQKNNATSCALRVAKSTMEGDTAEVLNAAIFLCNEKNGLYNDCECTQNIPVIDGLAGQEPLERQDIYSSHAAMVYAYSPYRSDMRVDSIHWCIDDFDPLLVAIPRLITSHFPEVSLEFGHVMGKVSFLLDGESCEDVTLEGCIPLEGCIDLVTSQQRVLRELSSLHITSAEQNLFPSYYKDMRVRIREKDFLVDLNVMAGLHTRVHLTSGSLDAKTEILTW